MRFEDEIYFSQNYQWNSIVLSDEYGLIEKFQDRVQSLYLKPALGLLEMDIALSNSFSVGVILFSCIEWVGTYLTHKNGFKNKIEQFLIKSDQFIALDGQSKTLVLSQIVECFRNGIIHNGRVKDSCQFDVFFENKLFVLHDKILILNTRPLYSLVEGVFGHYIELLKNDALHRRGFISIFEKQFSSELKKLK